MVECSKIVTQSKDQNVENQQVIDAVTEAVEQHQIFGDLLTTVEKQYLLDRGVVRSVLPGVKLCRESHRDDKLFILVVGEVEASSGEDANRIHIASLKQGEIFGEIAALFGMPRVCDVTVIRPSVVLEVASEVLHSIIEARTELRDAVLSRFRDRITETALRAVPMFRFLTTESMKSLVEHSTVYGAPPGSILIEEGEAGDSLFVVIYGRLRVSHDVEGKHLNLALLQPGDYFGEWSLLTGSPRTATISALSQVELVCVERSAFLEVVQKHPEIRDRIDLEAHNRHDQLETTEALSGEYQAKQNLDGIKNILKSK